MENKQENCRVKRWDLMKTRLNNLSPLEAQDFLSTQVNCTIIDCRRPAELEIARLPHAINIDYLAYDFWEKIKKLPSDETYFIYCNSCRRSTRACTLMQNGGFTSVYNLDGGLKAWMLVLGEEGILRGD